MDFVRPVEAVLGGARGRLLSVLANVTAPLTLRRLASLAGVSPAQASRVMPRLVELGIVDRSEVPPASQFVLVRGNVAARAILALVGAHPEALKQIGEAAVAISPAPISVIVFGSFARREADAASDIDIVVVRGDDVDADDDGWSDSLEAWRRHVRLLAGNDVELIDAAASEVSRKLRGRSELWRQIKQDGIVMFGAGIDALAERAEDDAALS